MKRTLLVLLGLAAAAVFYGTVVEPRWRLDVAAFEARVPALAPEWEGERVALFSDLQIGMWADNDGMARRVVARAVEEGAALALFAGDFVYSPDSAAVDRAVEIVRPLAEAGVPLVAALGNHDYSMMKRESEIDPDIAGYLRQRLAEAGATVLVNEAVRVRLGGGDLWVAGVGSVWAGESRPREAVAAVPEGAPRLVLMHNPTAFREIGPGEAPLALAGHTHGGQIRLPLLGDTRSWLDIVDEGDVVADGWAERGTGAEGNRLYVNRGVGFSGVPVRINCRPELTLFTLRRAEGRLPARGPAPGA